MIVLFNNYNFFETVGADFKDIVTFPAKLSLRDTLIIVPVAGVSYILFKNDVSIYKSISSPKTDTLNAISSVGNLLGDGRIQLSACA